MTETFQCELHPDVTLVCGEHNHCEQCVALLSAPLVPKGDERAEELQGWIQRPLTVPFSDLHKRIEDLVGRPVWTHELGLAVDRLVEEARGAQSLTSVDEVVNDLRNTGKPVIEVRVSDD